MLYTLIDPLLQYCSLSASAIAPVEAAVYLCNCLYTYQASLAKFEYTDAKLEQVQCRVPHDLSSCSRLHATRSRANWTPTSTRWSASRRDS